MADMREIVQEDTESRETLMDLWWGLLTDVQHIEVLSQVVQTCKTGDADGLLALLTSPEVCRMVSLLLFAIQNSFMLIYPTRRLCRAYNIQMALKQFCFTMRPERSVMLHLGTDGLIVAARSWLLVQPEGCLSLSDFLVGAYSLCRVPSLT